MRRSLSLLAAAALVVSLGAPAYAGNARDPAEDKKVTAMRDRDDRRGRHHRGDSYRHRRHNRGDDSYRHRRHSRDRDDYRHRYNRRGYNRHGYHRSGYSRHGYYGDPYYGGRYGYYDDPYYRDCYSGPGSWRSHYRYRYGYDRCQRYYRGGNYYPYQVNDGSTAQTPMPDETAPPAGEPAAPAPEPAAPPADQTAPAPDPAAPPADMTPAPEPMAPPPAEEATTGSPSDGEDQAEPVAAPDSAATEDEPHHPAWAGRASAPAGPAGPPQPVGTTH